MAKSHKSIKKEYSPEQIGKYTKNGQNRKEYIYIYVQNNGRIYTIMNKYIPQRVKRQLKSRKK